MKITIVGLGYVGLANALFLASHHEVIGYDIDEHKVDCVNHKSCPLADQSIAGALANKNVMLRATSDIEVAYETADIIIIATSTDLNHITKTLDITSIETTVADIIAHNQIAKIIIRSTVPIGTTDMLSRQYPKTQFFFVPEFLREGSAFMDTLNPTRIVIGGPLNQDKTIEHLLTNGLETKPPVLFTSTSEAEAIKLLSNSYLAMRIGFFNELSTLADLYNLNAKHLIEGLSYDPRIGQGYNNPSFGFSGYCLPKDTSQLAEHFPKGEAPLIQAISQSNKARINHVIGELLKRNPRVVGIYRLTMKMDSQNIRYTIVHEIIKQLKEHNIIVKIYEPLIKQHEFNGIPIINDLKTFANSVDVIVANRVDSLITKYSNKLFTSDVFHTDR